MLQEMAGVNLVNRTVSEVAQILNPLPVINVRKIRKVYVRPTAQIALSAA
jgi:hypothetical protein